MNTREPTVGLFVLLFCVLVVTAGCGKKFVRGVSGASEFGDVSSGTFAQEQAGERDGDAGDTSVFDESLEPLENVLPLEETMDSADASAFSDDERARMTGKTGTRAAPVGQAGATAETASEQAVDDSVDGNAGNGTTGQAASPKGVSVSPGLQDVYFAFNSWQLSERARQVLEANAKWLNARQHESLTIEGHCDERGTRAYNYVLGEKRATMVKQYLSLLGVPDHRMMVVSFGKDQPKCREFSEKCFHVNRRAHFVSDVNAAAR